LNQKINDGINRILEMNDELLKSLGNLILLKDIFSTNNLLEKNPNINYLSLLQRKRRLENPYLNSNNNFSFQKEINIGMPNINNFQTNNDKRIIGHFPIEQNNSQIEPILNLSEFQGNNTEFEIKNNCSNYSNSDNNNLKEVFVNDDVNTNKNFLFGNNLNFNNNNINNSINNIIINDEKEKNFKNTSNSLSFSINSFLEENGNKIKVVKNNKTVYMNSYWIYNQGKKPNSSKNSLVLNGRSSKYRGVSKNGNNWQVFLMMNRCKTYVGTYPSEEIAARVYDIMAIKCRGLKARTNFIYNIDQMKMIKEIDVDIKSKNIVYEIISKLTA
jgi:hypothetical protein